MEVMESVALGVLVNTVYDIIKHFCLKYNVKIQEYFTDNIERDVKEEIIKSTPEEIKSLFDSGTFVTYFQSPQFLDLINSYLEYKLMYTESRFSEISNV